MADLVNPYANPYLPAFVNQRPMVNNQSLTASSAGLNIPTYSQIRSVAGFGGARSYATNNLAPGSSDILAETDPNIARIYIVAKDQNNQTIVEGYRLIREEEPKPVTMDDLNAKLSEVLDRVNKLEEGNNNGYKPGSDALGKVTGQANGTRIQSGGRNGPGNERSLSNASADGTKRSEN